MLLLKVYNGFLVVFCIIILDLKVMYLTLNYLVLLNLNRNNLLSINMVGKLLMKILKIVLWLLNN
jgi:hypothetical protein